MNLNLIGVIGILIIVSAFIILFFQWKQEMREVNNQLRRISTHMEEQGISKTQRHIQFFIARR